MVYTYVRKTDRQSWSEESMRNAIEAVVGGSMGILRAAKTFAVPKTTLHRRVANKNKLIHGELTGIIIIII